MTGRARRVARLLLRDRPGLGAGLRLEWALARIELSGRLSRTPVTGTGEAIVNLTSYGHRASLVHYAIESIAAGSITPRRLILWLDDDALLANPPAALRRLQRRGLELRQSENFGPHKKQFPFALSRDSSGLPLVAADDDVLYPRDWLEGLLAAHQETPGEIVGYRAHTIVVTGESIAPYRSWLPRTGSHSSFAAMCTGVSGICYPVELVSALREEGDRFRQVAPAADDIWVHAVGVRHGIRSRQVGQEQAEFPAVPGSQLKTLYRRNVVDGGNDTQVAATYGVAEIARIAQDAATRDAPAQGSDAVPDAATRDAPAESAGAGAGAGAVPDAAPRRMAADDR